MPLVSILSFSQMLGATSWMRSILSLVSFPIYYSQLCEKHWWRDQQQSLTIRPGAASSYSGAKETLISAARDRRAGAKLAKAGGGVGLWFLRAGWGSTHARLRRTQSCGVWCIIQEQVMYRRCILGRFNKSRSCLSFGGSFVRVFYLV